MCLESSIFRELSQNFKQNQPTIILLANGFTLSGLPNEGLFAASALRSWLPCSEKSACRCNVLQATTLRDDSHAAALLTWSVISAFCSAIESAVSRLNRSISRASFMLTAFGAKVTITKLGGHTLNVDLCLDLMGERLVQNNFQLAEPCVCIPELSWVFWKDILLRPLSQIKLG
jgi:hypothetical protein